MYAFVTNFSPQDCLPVCISHSSITLCENRVKTVYFCVLVVQITALALILWALLSRKGGSGFIPVIEIPGSPNRFFLREWTWPIVKGRHPLFVCVCAPCNSHSDAVEQERAHSQLSAQ